MPDSGGRHKASRRLDMSLAQHGLLGGVPDDGQPVLAHKLGKLGLVAVNHDERSRFPSQFAGNTAAHAARTANDVVILQTADVVFHFASSEELEQFGFQHCLSDDPDHDKQQRHAADDQEDVENPADP